MKTEQSDLDRQPSDCSVKEKSSDTVVGGKASPGTRAVEIGGRTGPEPTRFGDWEKGGRCIDF